jgi:flagellar biosynthetic protein FlhB
MAEGEEKVHPATPKRRDEARRRGQTARSADLTGAVGLLAAVIALHLALPSGLASLTGYVHHAFTFDIADARASGAFDDRLRSGLHEAAVIVAPAILAALILGVFAAAVQTGFLVAPQALAPQWNRVSPASGFARLFSRRAAFDVTKGLLKLAILGIIGFVLARGALFDGTAAALSRMGLMAALATFLGLLWRFGLWVGIALLVLGVADFAFQRYEHERELRLSASELRRETRESEGDPHVRARLRKAQRVAARRR